MPCHGGHTQKLTHKPDGSVILQMTVSDLHKVAWWTLSWGHNARVLAPPQLGQLVTHEARGILRLDEGAFDKPKGDAYAASDG